MNDVPLHSGSRWEPPGGPAPSTSGRQAPVALADPAPVTVAPASNHDERRRRRGPHAALVALLALLVMVLSGAVVAWGDQLRALVHPVSSAAPAANHGGGSQRWTPDEPGDGGVGGGEPGGGLGPRHQGAPTGTDGDGQRGDHGQFGGGTDDANGTNDGNSSTQGGA